jgi:hypothetical protein
VQQFLTSDLLSRALEALSHPTLVLPVFQFQNITADTPLSLSLSLSLSVFKKTPSYEGQRV